MSVHIPRYVVKSECSFLNLSRIQRCPWSDRLGIVHETVNVIDLVIREATPDEQRTPVWINSNTSLHSICVCHVLLRRYLVHLSLGQRARNSKPTSQSRSNQRLLILGSCDQGFDFRSVVVQTLRGQTVETGIQVKIVIILWHFLM